MNGVRPAEILRQLEQTTLNDRDLLARFVHERDQSAFREIITRHGPSVLGVCKRVTGHRQDAEDAFQVVFLILARKAKTICKPDVLGCWLYGVALRVAQTARRSTLRRRAKEITLSALPEPMTASTDVAGELTAVLDEELTALPSWYRDAIILCDLRGLSREEAANALRVPEGTLSSRLAKGRKTLSARLTKRGITLSAGTVSSTLFMAQAGNVSAELIAKSCNQVIDWMAGARIPKPLVKLTNEGLAMWKSYMVGAFAFVLAVTGIIFAAHSSEDASTDPQPIPPVLAAKSVNLQQPAADPKPEAKAVDFTSTPKLRHVNDVSLINVTTLCWNPDGTRLAIAGQQPQGYGAAARNLVHIISFDPMKTFYLNIKDYCQFVGFTSDGRHVLTEQREYHLTSGIHKLTVWEQVPETNETVNSYKIVREIDLPATETRGYALASDGKTFRAVTIERDETVVQPEAPAQSRTGPGGGGRSPQQRFSSVSTLEVQEYDFTTGKLIKSLLKVEPKKQILTQALSLDGRKLAVLENQETLVVYDVDRAVRLCSSTLKPDHLEGFRKSEITAQLAFSPNGGRLAASRGIGATNVVNSDNGDLLPALDGSGAMWTSPGLNAFSKDGRLLALCGSRYSVPQMNREWDGSLGALGTFLAVWDTQTGKTLKTWKLNSIGKVAFNPVRPTLVLIEPNGEQKIRLGLWDLSAETAEKK